MFAGVFREATTDFTVDARALTQNGGHHIKTLISNPSGSCTDALITDLGDGTYSVEYTPYEEGERQHRHSSLSIQLQQLKSLVFLGGHIHTVNTNMNTHANRAVWKVPGPSY